MFIVDGFCKLVGERYHWFRGRGRTLVTFTVQVTERLPVFPFPGKLSMGLAKGMVRTYNFAIRRMAGALNCRDLSMKSGRIHVDNDEDC